MSRKKITRNIHRLRIFFLESTEHLTDEVVHQGRGRRKRGGKERKSGKLRVASTNINGLVSGKKLVNDYLKESRARHNGDCRNQTEGSIATKHHWEWSVRYSYKE